MSFSVALAVSLSKSSRLMPAAAKASSVGAKTVNGPSPWRVSVRLTWSRAATSESCTPVAAALSGMSFVSSAAALKATVENARQATKMSVCARFMHQRLVQHYLRWGFFQGVHGPRAGSCLAGIDAHWEPVK